MCVSSQTCVLFRAQTTNTDVLKCSRRLSQEGSPLPDTRNHAPKGPTHAIEVSQKKLCSAMISRCLSYSRVSLVARVNFPKAALLFTPSDTSWPCRTFPKLTLFGQDNITQGLHRTVEMIQPNLLTLCGGTVRHEWPLSEHRRRGGPNEMHCEWIKHTPPSKTVVPKSREMSLYG